VPCKNRVWGCANKDAVFEDKELADQATRAVEKTVNEGHMEGELEGDNEKAGTRTREVVV
jgi:hypothetical protein